MSWLPLMNNGSFTYENRKVFASEIRQHSIEMKTSQIHTTKSIGDDFRAVLCIVRANKSERRNE